MVVRGSGAFETSGGLELFEQWWRPEGTPRGVVLLVHGYAEHSGRYEEAGEFLAGRGYAVEAFDLRGHGRSEGRRAVVGSMNEYLVDLGHFLRIVRERHPGRAIFLLGHSMGGCIATLYAITRKPSLDGLVLSGPAIGGMTPPLPLRVGVSLLARVKPEAGTVPFRADSISRDPAVVSSYVADPLVYTGKMKAGLAAAFLRATERIAREMEEVELPLLVMHGTADTAAPPRGSEELYARTNTHDKTLKLYEGLYHEIFNEPEREAVLADLAAWLDDHTPAVEGEG